MKPRAPFRTPRSAVAAFLTALSLARVLAETVYELRGNDPRNWRVSFAVQTSPERGSLTSPYVIVVGGSRNFVPTRLAVDTLGNVYVGGTVSWEFGTDAALVKVDNTGRIVFTTIVGGDGFETVSAVAVDGAGRAYLAGTTTSPDFPGIRLGGTPGETGPWDGFIVRLTPEGGLAYAVRLGGSRRTEVGGLAVDREGAAYLAGWTEAQDFPFTAGAFESATPGGAVQSVAFVSKLSPAGDRLIYAAALGGAKIVCAEAGPCLHPLAARSSAEAIVVDGAGNAYVAGLTNATDFPVTPGALSSDCRCSVDRPNAFVTRLAADGSRLLFSTFLAAPSAVAFRPGVTVAGLALHPSGSVFVTGATTSDQFPVTPGAWRTVRDPATAPPGEPAAFVARLSPDASRLEYSTLLSGLGGER
ncbi:MAG: SBBP repeat-containing protein, partial [Bryobacteraceae bacterium]|nr:SBBP repeat-containing protein [Bryobacteraceae bacterium]